MRAQRKIEKGTQVASTLIVGLGGMGGRMVKRIYNRVKTSGSSGDVQFVFMDTDINDLR